jgi:hypothetical protein
MTLENECLREIGKEFQSRGAQVEKALPPNDLSLKDCSDRRCFDKQEHVAQLRRCFHDTSKGQGDPLGIFLTKLLAFGH